MKSVDFKTLYGIKIDGEFISGEPIEGGFCWEKGKALLFSEARKDEVLEAMKKSPLQNGITPEVVKIKCKEL